MTYSILFGAMADVPADELRPGDYVVSCYSDALIVEHITSISLAPSVAYGRGYQRAAYPDGRVGPAMPESMLSAFGRSAGTHRVVR